MDRRLPISPIPNNLRKNLDSLKEPYSEEGYQGTKATDKDRTTDRTYHTRRDDDTVGNIKVDLKDNDSVIPYYFENVIKPTVVKDGTSIEVPLIYGGAEIWKTVQRDGYYRDKEAKIQVPLIMFKRNTVTKRRDIGNKLDGNQAHLFQTFEKKYSSKNQYDNFDILNNRSPQKEYHAVVVPDYVTLTYDCIIWTEYVENMNKLVEAINFASDSYWGDPNRWKFKATIDSFQNQTEVTVGGNRIVRTTFTLTLNGYLIPDVYNKALANKTKFSSVTNIKFTDEQFTLQNAQTQPQPTISSFTTGTGAGGGSSTAFPFTGNAIINGSLTVTEGVSGSFVGDGSGLTGVTAEWDGSHLGDASITGSLTVTGGVSGSFEGDGSQITGVISSSYSTTSSYAFYAVSASHEIIKEVSSSYADTASLAQSGNGIFSGSFSGSFEGDGSGLVGLEPFPFTGDAVITGSLLVSGSSGVDIEANQSISVGNQFKAGNAFLQNDIGNTAKLHLGLGLSSAAFITTQRNQLNFVRNTNSSGAGGVNLLVLSSMRDGGAEMNGDEFFTAGDNLKLYFQRSNPEDNYFGYITRQSVGYFSTTAHRAIGPHDIINPLGTTNAGAGNTIYFTSGSNYYKGITLSNEGEVNIPSGSISASYFVGDGSQLTNLPLVTSASYALTSSYSFYAVSASYEITKEVSSSYADTASFAQSGNGIFSGSFSGSYVGEGSGLTNIPASGIVGLNLSQIASGSSTASISPNGGLFVNTNITSSGNITSANNISASNNLFTKQLYVENNLAIDYDFTNNCISLGNVSDCLNLLGTGVTASSNISSSGYISSSFFIGDGSQLTNLPLVTSASYALTASYIEVAQTASYVISSSIDGITNYVRNDQTSSMTVATASYVETAQTASYVLNAVSSSYSAFAVSASYAVSASHEIIKEVSSSYADTASFAQSGNGIFSGSFSGSYVGDGSGLTGVDPFPFSGSALITGSLSIVNSDSDNNYLGDGSVQGRGLLAVGSQVSASRINSVAFGEQTKANAQASLAQGYNTIVEYRIAADQASYAHAEGWETSASAYGAHSEGYKTQAGSIGKNAFGPDLGRYSHAEGWETKTLAFSSHAEGYKTQAGYLKEIAPGFFQTRGNYSHAEGQGTIASGSYQHVQGKYNTHGNDTSLMVIGNGTDDSNRSDLALFNANGIVFNQPLTASVVSGSFEGDGSGITGIVSSSYALTASYAVSASHEIIKEVSSSYADTASFAQSGNGIFSGSFSGSFEGISNTSSYALTASYVETAQTASYVLNAVSSSFSSFAISASYAVSASHEIIKEVSSSYADTASFAQSGDGIFSGSFSGSYVGDGSGLTGVDPFPFSGSAVITGSLLVSGSSLPLEIIGSGSTVFSVQGSLGELFAIDDVLSGSLLVVNDISGLPQFEVFSDGRTLIGADPRSLYTTATISATAAATSESIYSLSTSSYDGVFFDYTVTSASNARAGNIMSIWNGGNLVYTENTTTDIGSTVGVTFNVEISQSQAQLISVTDTAGWKIKTTIRSI